MEDYRYSSISGERERPKIRLVEIHPDTNGPVECTLNDVFLDDPPDYQALSYTWNNEKPCEPIICSGQRLHITPNLHAALLQLRDSNTPRTVWVDAICINQANDAEKSAQVLLMPTIYRGAARVIVWLGKEGGESQVAMAFIRDIFERKDTTRPAVTSKNILQDFKGRQKKAWKAVNNLLSRAWFRRVWVIQEAALPSSVSILCGSDELPWEAMFSMLRHSYMTLAYQTFDVAGLLGWNAIAVIHTVQEALRESGGVPLLDILESSRGFLATDTKDKLYAVFSLCRTPERDELSITPDYRSTTLPATVFNSFAKKYLQTSRSEHANIELLYYAAETDSVLKGEIPSWVPDWSVANHRPPLIDRLVNDYPEYQASLSSIPTVKFQEAKNLLGLSGHICDHISIVGSPMSRTMLDSPSFGTKLGERMRQQYATLVEWEEVVNARSTKLYPTGETMSRAFHCTLLGGYLASKEGEDMGTAEVDYMAWSMRLARILHRLHLDTFPSAVTLAKDFIQFMKPGIWGSTKSEEKYYTMVINMARAVAERKIFVSRDGYIGLVPAEARIGDAIALIKGSKLPFVLRRDGDTNMWRLVGCCYVHGMMHGQRFREPECEDIWLR